MNGANTSYGFAAAMTLVLLGAMFSPGPVTAQTKPAEQKEKKTNEQKKSRDELLEEQVRKERERNRLLREKRAANAKRLRELRVKRIEHQIGYQKYRRAFTRSLIFPGLGQWMLEKKLKGGLFMGGGVLLLHNLFSAWNDWRAAGADYANQEVPVAIAAGIRSTDAVAVNNAYFQERRAALDSSRSNLNIALLLAAGLYFYNLYDITRENPVRKQADAVRRPVLLLSRDTRPESKPEGTHHTRLDFGWKLRF